MVARHPIGAVATVATIALAGLLAGCGGSDGGAASAPPATAGARQVEVWFADDSGALVAERRAAVGPDPLAAAVAALAEGPQGRGLIPALPPGTTVLATRIEDGVAVVDLGDAFERGYPRGGSAAELATVAPLVRTASEAAGTPRVRILVEGRPAAPVGAQLDLSRPLSPAELAPGR